MTTLTYRRAFLHKYLLYHLYNIIKYIYIIYSIHCNENDYSNLM